MRPEAQEPVSPSLVPEAGRTRNGKWDLECAVAGLAGGSGEVSSSGELCTPTFQTFLLRWFPLPHLHTPNTHQDRINPKREELRQDQGVVLGN